MKKLKLSIAFLCIGLFIGCATVPGYKNMVAGMYQFYISQSKDYRAMAADPTLTDAQKNILRQKKPLLDKLGALIPLFDSSVSMGTPNMDQQQQINNLINQLSKL